MNDYILIKEIDKPVVITFTTNQVCFIEKENGNFSIIMKLSKGYTK